MDLWECYENEDEEEHNRAALAEFPDGWPCLTCGSELNVCASEAESCCCDDCEHRRKGGEEE